jgi:protein HIRA/HIR1
MTDAKAFNPRLFFAKDVKPSRGTATCMLALGADDFSISIWRNTLHKPLAVLQDIFSHPLLDLCWSVSRRSAFCAWANGTGRMTAITCTDARRTEPYAPSASTKTSCISRISAT